MPDFCDRASALSEIYTQAALQARARAAVTPGESLAECEDCGEEIPEARRKAVPGCTRCTDCQEFFDRMGAA